jgi:hypothetical protein
VARKIEIDLTSDTKSFERGMDTSAKAVDKLDDHLGKAEQSAGRFHGSLDKTTDGLENTTGKLRSTNDLVDGFSSVVGLSLPPQASMILGFADMADGLSGLLGPALKGAKSAFAAMNATLLANPIFLVIAVIAALGIALVVAYKKSETFRKIVNAAFHSVTDGAKAFWDYTKQALVGAAKAIGKIADIITTPYQLAFKAIAHLWNATVGGFSVPSIGFGPFKTPGFSVPNMPELAAGGPLAGNQVALVGERGPELFVPHTSGSVVRNGGIGGGAVTVYFASNGDPIWEAIRKQVRVKGGTGPGSVQKALG